MSPAFLQCCLVGFPPPRVVGSQGQSLACPRWPLSLSLLLNKSFLAHIVKLDKPCSYYFHEHVDSRAPTWAVQCGTRRTSNSTPPTIRASIVQVLLLVGFFYMPHHIDPVPSHMMMKLGPGEDEVFMSLVPCSKHTSFCLNKTPFGVKYITSDSSHGYPCTLTAEFLIVNRDEC